MYQDDALQQLLAMIPQIRQYPDLMAQLGQMTKGSFGVGGGVQPLPGGVQPFYGGVQPLPGGVQPFYGPSGPRPGGPPRPGVESLPGGVQPVIGSAQPSGSNWGFGGSGMLPPSPSPMAPAAPVQPGGHAGPNPRPQPLTPTERGPQPVPRQPTVAGYPVPPGGGWPTPRPGATHVAGPLRVYNQNGPGTAR